MNTALDVVATCIVGWVGLYCIDHWMSWKRTSEEFIVLVIRLSILTLVLVAIWA